MEKTIRHIQDNKKDILVTVILIICFAGLILYNTVSYQITRNRTGERIERHKILEAEQQEKLAAREATRELIEFRRLTRDQDIKDIISFDERYSRIKKEYLSLINRIAEEMDNKVVNIDDIVSLAGERIEASERFREGIMNMVSIPEPLEGFYDLLLEFLDNDIFTWKETRSYYSGTYDGDVGDIRQLHNINTRLYRQVEELQREVYSRYGLGGLLQ